MEVLTVRVGAGLLDAVPEDVERDVVLLDAVLEDDAFLVVAIGVYYMGQKTAPVNSVS